MIRLGQHFTDVPRGGRVRKRRIQNWVNYREPGSGWLPSDPRPDAVTGKPDNWPDNFTHQIFARRGPAQVALGNDPSGRPHVRVRHSQHPGQWAEFIWLQGDSVPLTTSNNNRRVRWVDWRNNTNLSYVLTGRGVRKTIRLKAPAHPAAFRFAVKLPPGHTCKLIGQRLIIRDDQGVEYMSTSAPYGFDSSTITPTADGTQAIRVTLAEDSTTPQGWTVYSLTPDPNDLASATYPITLDPTINISGTANIDDVYVREFVPTLNHGSGIALWTKIAATNDYIGLIRLATAAIPEALSYDSLDYNKIMSSGSMINDWFRVVAANVRVEGTLNGFPQAGSCSYNEAQAGILTWAGGNNGCSILGTDYDAGSLAAMDNTSPTSIDTAALSDWFGGAANNGWVIISRGSGNLIWRSTERVGFEPSFDLTYTAIPPGISVTPPLRAVRDQSTVTEATPESRTVTTAVPDKSTITEAVKNG